MYRVTIWDEELTFETSADMFCPDGADRGTLAMLEEARPNLGGLTLDLGCGYGLVGVLLARVIGADKVVMSDVVPGAVRLAKANALRNGVPDVAVIESDGLSAITERGFDMILSNPPYHTDYAVAKRFIEDGFRHLRVGGRMLLVVKREQWYRNKLQTVFGGVRSVERDGYYVLTAEKRATARRKAENPAKNTLSRKLQRKQPKRAVHTDEG